MTEETTVTVESAPEAPKVIAAYIVAINADGSTSTQPLTEGTQRPATTFDIFQTSKQLASEIEGLLLAERVAKAVASMLKPADPSAETAAAVSAALSERGIDPTQA